jgi:lipase maturation factor 1
LVAFGSLWPQLGGLIGARGISPASELLSWVKEQLGWKAYLKVPTLCWISSADGVLRGMCALGMALSVLLILGVAPRWILVALWILYLSLVSVGDVFLQYQWDNLLLETAFFSIFLASPRILPRRSQPAASPLALWLLRWLLFRLMFLSGVVKLASGDAAWRDLTALRFHYWTQPLPTPLSYYVNLLPDGFQTASAVVMFAIELVVPLLIFGPRRARLFAAASIASLQIAIAATGNYGFFNLLSLALCLLLLDDATLSKILSRRLAISVETVSVPTRLQHGLRTAFAVTAVFLVMVSVAEMRFWRRDLPSPIEDLLGVLQPFRSINSYGLFAVMTTKRPEIIVEGSGDGRIWRTYEFKWKPGNPERPPRFVAPHQPRLDWQMWFAALGSCARNPWFVRFQKHLLEGTPDVMRLLNTNPFPAALPRYIRSTVYDYRFSNWGEHQRAHVFWDRAFVGAYCPILSLQNGRLVAVSARSLEER